MLPPLQVADRVHFGSFEVDLATAEVFRKGRKVRLSGQPAQVLVILLQRPGQLVTREELRALLWPEETFVDFDHGLNNCINRIREVLGDSLARPRYVETLPKQGYRFVASVLPTEIATATAEAAPPEAVRAAPSALVEPQVTSHVPSTAKAHASRRFPPPVLLASGAVAAILICILIWYAIRPLPPPSITEYSKITHDGQLKWLAATDGNRLYFNQLQPLVNAQVAIADGEIAPVQVPLQDPWIEDVSPDGSTLLVAPRSGDELWSVGVLGGSFRRITIASIDSSLGTAVWSPDGKSIAYSTLSDEIFRIRNDGSEIQKLVSNEHAWALAWSPDGERLRFTSDEELWEMSTHGSSPKKLLSGWAPSDWKCCGRWTPDGAFYIFVSGKLDERRSGESLWALDERRRPFQSTASPPIKLTSGPTRWGSPIPSKDGKTIFARGVTLRGELSRYDSQSKQLLPFLGGISAEFVAFSSDRKWVAYVSYPEGILWKADRDGSNPVRLSDPPLYPKSISWSPDNSQIAFWDKPIGASNAESYVVSSQGGRPRRLLAEQIDPRHPNWSPDGLNLVFSASFIKGSSSNSFIGVLDSASNQVTVLPGSEGLASPQWSPDGHFIGVLSGENPEIYNVETKQWTALPVGPVNAITWSNNAHFVYFLRTLSDPGVFRASIQTGKVEKVVDLRGYRITGRSIDWFGLDPDDTPLVLHDVGTEDIYALTLDRK